jgi:hypothetical protein
MNASHHLSAASQSLIQPAGCNGAVLLMDRGPMLSMRSWMAGKPPINGTKLMIRLFALLKD